MHLIGKFEVAIDLSYVVKYEFAGFVSPIPVACKT